MVWLNMQRLCDCDGQFLTLEKLLSPCKTVWCGYPVLMWTKDPNLVRFELDVTLSSRDHCTDMVSQIGVYMDDLRSIDCYNMYWFARDPMWIYASDSGASVLRMPLNALREKINDFLYV